MRNRFMAAASFAALMLLPTGAIFADAGPSEQKLAELETQYGELQASCATIMAKADEEGRGGVRQQHGRRLEQLHRLEAGPADARQRAIQRRVWKATGRA